MKLVKKSVFLHFSSILLAALLMAWPSSSVNAVEFQALDSVKRVNAVFDITRGSPRTGDGVFGAV